MGWAKLLCGAAKIVDGVVRDQMQPSTRRGRPTGWDGWTVGNPSGVDIVNPLTYPGRSLIGLEARKEPSLIFYPGQETILVEHLNATVRCAGAVLAGRYSRPCRGPLIYLQGAREEGITVIRLRWVRPSTGITLITDIFRNGINRNTVGDLRSVPQLPHFDLRAVTALLDLLVLQHTGHRSNR